MSNPFDQLSDYAALTGDNRCTACRAARAPM